MGRGTDNDQATRRPDRAGRRRPRVLRLAAACPICHRAPAERIPPAERDRYAGDPPGRIVLWTQCRGRGCGAVYPIHARAYQEATKRSAVMFRGGKLAPALVPPLVPT